MNTIPGWSHETTLAAEPVSVSKARNFTSGHLLAHGLPYLVEDIRLVVSELATNALLHARTPFVVAVSEANGFVLLVIRDGCPSIPVTTLPQVMDLGGRGLMLVALLSHEWGSDTDIDGAKSVWASFATQARHGPAPLSA